MPRTRSDKPKRNIWQDGPPDYGTYEGPRGNRDEWAGAFGEAWNATTARDILGNQSAWEVLGVSVGASMAVITRAFRRLMLQHHPDHGGDPETCRKVIAAYAVLRNAHA